MTSIKGSAKVWWIVIILIIIIGGVWWWNDSQSATVVSSAATPDAPAFLYPEEGAWKFLSWRETGVRVREIACGLLSLGLAAGDRVAIVSSTRVEWILADLAVGCAGGVTATVYPVSTEEDTSFILSDSRAAVVFAEDAAQARRIQGGNGAVSRPLVLFDASAGLPGNAMSLLDLAAKGGYHINFETFEATVGDEPVRLTQLEMTLLRYFVENESRVIPRRELLENVWGMPGTINTRAPDQFIRRLRKTFEPDHAQPRHFLTIRDFEILARDQGWTVDRKIFISGRRVGTLFANLMAEVAVFLVSAAG